MQTGLNFVVVDVPTIGERKFVKWRADENPYSRLRRRYGQEMILIKAEDFEAGWSTASGYIPADLSKKTYGNNIERFEKFLAENEVIEVANVHINVGGRIGFRDGRHRTRVLLNLGMEAIPVTMTKESVDWFERYYPCDQD
jgi:hypothetical protein